MAKLELSQEEREQLESTVRRRRVARSDALKARVILLAADGQSNTEIVRRTGLSAPTVGKWRSRLP